MKMPQAIIVNFEWCQVVSFPCHSKVKCCGYHYPSYMSLPSIIDTVTTLKDLTHQDILFFVSIWFILKHQGTQYFVDFIHPTECLRMQISINYYPKHFLFVWLKLASGCNDPKGCWMRSRLFSRWRQSGFVLGHMSSKIIICFSKS